MQAQAAGEGGGSFLSNPKVQIGLIAGGALALIAVVVMLIMNNNNASPAPTPTPATGAPAPPGGGTAAGGPGSPISSTVPPAPPGPGGPGSPMASTGGPVGASGFGGAPSAPSAAGAPGAPGAAKEGAAPKKGAGVPVRGNPFAENTELKDVLASIPEPPGQPKIVAQEHRLYQDELHTAKPVVDVSKDDQNDGPPIPTMRVAGVVYGKQISATLQIGDQYMQVTPGQMVEFIAYESFL